jgi:hypothetical protein
MMDELRFLQQRIERLEVTVGDVRERLVNCVQVSTRPQDALVLARSVAETLVKQMLAEMQIKPTAMLDACLRELERPEVLSRGLVPPEIISILHLVRVMGNKASHASLRIQVSETDVLLVLRPLLRVVEWYFAEFDHGPKLAPLFRDSTAISYDARSTALALEQSIMLPVEKPPDELMGKWSGRGHQDHGPGDQPTAFGLTVCLRPNGNRIEGDMTIDGFDRGKRYQVDFAVVGGMVGGRFAWLNYISKDASRPHFGTMILDRTRDPLSGNYVGYGALTKNVISGWTDLSKSP